MSDMTNLTDEQQAKLGEDVANVKALLNDVEAKISNHDVKSVDWDQVSAKLNGLGARITELSGKEKSKSVAEDPVPTDTTYPNPTPPKGGKK